MPGPLDVPAVASSRRGLEHGWAIDGHASRHLVMELVLDATIVCVSDLLAVRHPSLDARLGRILARRGVNLATLLGRGISGAEIT